MEQKSKNRIRFVLFLFLFGFMSISAGLGLTIRPGFNIEGIIGFLMIPLGIMCIVLGIHLIKKKWY